MRERGNTNCVSPRQAAEVDQLLPALNILPHDSEEQVVQGAAGIQACLFSQAPGRRAHTAP